MADRQRQTGETNRVTRRRLLATLGVATATGLAGCGGGSDGGGAGTDDMPTMGGTPTPPPEMEQTPTEPSMESPTEATAESGTGPGSDSTGPLTCTDFAGEYTAFDPGERRLIFRGEYPSAYREPSYDPTFVTMATAFGTDAPRAEIQFGQSLESNETLFPERDGFDPFLETTFDGETYAVGRSRDPRVTQGVAVQGIVRITGTYGGRERGFAIRILSNVLPEEDSQEDCRASLEEAVRHGFETLEANPDTTVAEML
jgi:hypothetical protein